MSDTELSLNPNEGDYVLATKYSDGDFGDQWAVGTYSKYENERHFVTDGSGDQFRSNGFRYARKISDFVGRYIIDNVPKNEPLPYVENFNMRDLLDDAYEAEVNQLRTELEQTQQHVADLIDASGQECACGYDKPDDVCLGHQPKFNKLNAKLEKLTAFAETVSAKDFLFNEFQGVQTRIEMKLSGLLSAALKEPS